MLGDLFAVQVTGCRIDLLARDRLIVEHRGDGLHRGPSFGVPLLGHGGVEREDRCTNDRQVTMRIRLLFVRALSCGKPGVCVS